MLSETAEIFASTAPWYRRFRPSYPENLVNDLGLQFGGREERLLDIGAGTGALTVPLARHFGQVIALEPSAEMLDEMRASADESEIKNIEYVCADASTIPGAIGSGPLHLATAAASFHWMNRSAVLGALEELVAPEGAVAIVSGGKTTEEPPWSAAVNAVRIAWLGEQRQAGRATYHHPADRHEAVLARSPFSVVVSNTYTQQIERDVDSIVGLQFSYSFTAPALLGERMGQFKEELRRAVEGAIGVGGIFTETLRHVVLLATRPGSGY